MIQYDHKVTVSQIEKCFDLEIPDFIEEHIHNLNLRYRKLTDKEQETHIESYWKFLNAEVVPSGPGRKNVWQTGWRQNLDELRIKGINDATLLPHYYRQGKTVMRYMGEFILPEDGLFESKFLTILRKLIAYYFLNEHKNIYEFGSGSCHNILAFAQELENKNFYMTDWVYPTIEITESIERQKRFLGISSHNFKSQLFDFFKPDINFRLKSDSLVLTFGSMEQIGIEFSNLLDYFLNQKTQHFLHIEPFVELYDRAFEFDELAYLYSKKRNYLNGYLSALKNLEQDGLITIEYQKRIIGSGYHDAHTIVKWKKLI